MLMKLERGNLEMDFFATLYKTNMVIPSKQRIHNPTKRGKAKTIVLTSALVGGMLVPRRVILGVWLWMDFSEQQLVSWQ